MAISFEDLEEEQAALMGRLASHDAQEDDGFALTGLEIALGNVASEIVVQIFASFISSVIYKVFNDYVTKEQIDKAKKELAGKEPVDPPPIPRSIVTQDTIVKLVKEGISQKGAEITINLTYDSVQIKVKGPH